MLQIESRGTATTPAVEELNTTLPFPDAFRRGCASWQRWKPDSKSVPITVDKLGSKFCGASFFQSFSELQEEIKTKLRRCIYYSALTYKDVRVSHERDMRQFALVCLFGPRIRGHTQIQFTLRPLLFHSSEPWSGSLWLREYVYIVTQNVNNSSTLHALTKLKNKN